MSELAYTMDETYQAEHEWTWTRRLRAALPLIHSGVKWAERAAHECDMRGFPQLADARDEGDVPASENARIQFEQGACALEQAMEFALWARRQMTSEYRNVPERCSQRVLHGMVARIDEFVAHVRRAHGHTIKAAELLYPSESQHKGDVIPVGAQKVEQAVGRAGRALAVLEGVA